MRLYANCRRCGQLVLESTLSTGYYCMAGCEPFRPSDPPQLPDPCVILTPPDLDEREMNRLYDEVARLEARIAAMEPVVSSLMAHLDAKSAYWEAMHQRDSLNDSVRRSIDSPNEATKAEQSRRQAALLFASDTERDAEEHFNEAVRAYRRASQQEEGIDEG